MVLVEVTVALVAVVVFHNLVQPHSVPAPCLLSYLCTTPSLTPRVCCDSPVADVLRAGHHRRRDTQLAGRHDSDTRHYRLHCGGGGDMNVMNKF